MITIYQNMVINFIIEWTFFQSFCEERESPPIEETLYAHRGGNLHNTIKKVNSRKRSLVIKIL